MFPILAAASAAGSILSNLVFGNRPSAPAPVTGPSFNSKLMQEVQSAQVNPNADLSQIQNLLATYRAHGTLPPDQKMALGKMLMNKTVQVVDSGGNSSNGVVAGFSFSNGELNLVINGRNQPLSSVQAVLYGVQTHV